MSSTAAKTLSLLSWQKNVSNGDTANEREYRITQNPDSKSAVQTFFEALFWREKYSDKKTDWKYEIVSNVFPFISAAHAKGNVFYFVQISHNPEPCTSRQIRGWLKAPSKCL